MSVLSAQPMTISLGMSADTDLDRPLYSLVVTWEWPGTDWAWSHFSLVRRQHSPAFRREEGAVVLETRPEDWGDPVYEDQSAPPDRWVCYSAFVLDDARVWQYVGHVYALGTGDHDWTINLPELLPGVSVSNAQQVVAKADPHNELVEFLQAPGLIYDRVMSYGESVQRVWDPLTAPPNMLPALLHTLGYSPKETLSPACLRQVAHSLLVERPQGSLRAIQAYASAATGVEAFVQESHNKMLSVLDSSFEVATRFDWKPPTIPPDPLEMIRDSGWDNLDKDDVELRRYDFFPTPPPALPTEVQDLFFLHFKRDAVISCGKTDPIRKGIPVQGWDSLRAGLFARGAGSRLSMVIELFGLDDTYLRSLTPLSNLRLNADWTWYPSPEQLPLPINMTLDPLLTDPTVWVADWSGTATPQNPIDTLVVNGRERFQFNWNTNPQPVGLPLEQPKTARYMRLMPIAQHEEIAYSWTMAGHEATNPKTSTPWRLVIGWGQENSFLLQVGPWNSASPNDTTASMLWSPPVGLAEAWFGIEVQQPPVITVTYRDVRTDTADYRAVRGKYSSYKKMADDYRSGGWAVDVQHTAVDAEVRAGSEGIAYWAVPVIAVSGEADIDLVVVDDV